MENNDPILGNSDLPETDGAKNFIGPSSVNPELFKEVITKIVEATLEELNSEDENITIQGPAKTAKDAGKVGKIIADKITDRAKKIEDDATKKLGDAEKAKHRKDNKDASIKSASVDADKNADHFLSSLLVIMEES